jgi:hydroxymethylbilane synthase
MAPNPLTIATRGSELALWQAEHIRSLLRAAWPSLPGAALLTVKTRGDLILDAPLAEIGGKGLFIKEIETALLDGRADIAVHSMKDLPVDLPEGLAIAAIPERGTCQDLFLSARWPDPASLPPGARVGTGSLRRQAQILALRPDLTIAPLRGNVDTRIAKLMRGDFEAVILARAGVDRLGLGAPCAHALSPDSFLPAPGQGALGVEIRADRDDVRALAARLDHFPSRVTVNAERGLLAGLEGGCHAPIAARARMLDATRFELTGLVADCRGERVVRRSITGEAAAARETGFRLAEDIKRAGGAAILAELTAAT